MLKKKTIGNNPLYAYIGSKKTKPSEAKEKKQELEVGKTQRVTIHVDVDLINAIKDVVYWQPGLTLTAFAHNAFSKALEKLEKKRGKKYPKRKEHNLHGGRPIG